MDAWHGILMGACGSLTTALGILWRALLKRDKQIAELHADHLADVKVLTRETIDLAKTLTSAPPLQLSASLPPESEG